MVGKRSSPFESWSLFKGHSFIFVGVCITGVFGAHLSNTSHTGPHHIGTSGGRGAMTSASLLSSRALGVGRAWQWRQLGASHRWFLGCQAHHQDDETGLGRETQFLKLFIPVITLLITRESQPKPSFATIASWVGRSKSSEFVVWERDSWEDVVEKT